MEHVPSNAIEECKVIKEYFKKYAAQRTHKDKEAISRGKKKSGKTIKFDGETQDFNTMVSHDAPISKKKKGKNMAKNNKSEKYVAVTLE